MHNRAVPSYKIMKKKEVTRLSNSFCVLLSDTDFHVNNGIQVIAGRIEELENVVTVVIERLRCADLCAHC